MKELWLYCKRYEAWKSKQDFAKDLRIVNPCYYLKPEDITKNCGSCPDCKIAWVDED